MPSDESKEPRVRVVDRRWWAQGDSAGTTEDPGGRKPTYVEELEKQVAESKDRLQEFMTEHRRSLDEFEQVKLRIRRDVAREVERGRRAVLVELLEVLDNLDRAIAASRDPAAATATDAGQLARGVELVRDQFLAKLESFGVSRLPALGQPFDVVRHEAVTTLPVDDRARDGVVMAVIKEGYAIGDEVLRPASVVVGQHPEAS